MTIRDRITELRRVRAGDLFASPKNWRTHPESQIAALRGTLAEVGYADAVICRVLPDGRLEVIDGHARKELDPDQIIPCLVTDLDEHEAAKLLVTLDPLAAMAETNSAALALLLAEVDTDNEALQAMLDELAVDAGVIPPTKEAPPEIEESTRHTVVLPYDESDVPTLNRFLGTTELPDALGQAIIDAIRNQAGRKPRKPARKKPAPRQAPVETAPVDPAEAPAA